MPRHHGTIKPGIINRGDKTFGGDSGCSADSDTGTLAAKDELTMGEGVGGGGIVACSRE